MSTQHCSWQPSGCHTICGRGQRRLAADVFDTGADDQISETVDAGEGGLADDCDAAGDRDGVYVVAVVERRVADGCDAAGDRDGGQFGTLVERVAAVSARSVWTENRRRMIHGCMSTASRLKCGCNLSG